MSDSKIRILYFYANYASFIERDIRILSKKYNVISKGFDVKKRVFLPFHFIIQLFFLLTKGASAKAIICMFGGYHSFLPSLFGRVFKKPSIIILGGTDCCSFPSLNYGLLQKFPIKNFVHWSYKLTDQLSPVHTSLILTKASYYPIDGEYQGIKRFFPDITTPFTEIFNGFNASEFRNTSIEKLKNSFITVAAGLNNPTRFKLKGADLIFQIAAYFPECIFTIVGMSKKPNQEIPFNLRLLPQVKHSELVNLYSQNEFYFQLSISEGFPNALCEAMLCECIPIGSNITSIPDIIGDTGFIVEKRDLELLKTNVNKALKADKRTLGKMARKRIEDLYPEKIREEGLYNLIESIINKY